MAQSVEKFLSLKNRLEKVYRHLSKGARRQGISCYRIYDHDLPEAPFIVEVYEDKLYVSEYKRRHNLGDEEHEEWLAECLRIMSEVTGIAPQNIYTKLRQRKEGRGGQYQKVAEDKNEFVVSEGGLKFIVNLSDYLDTGLFLDHRITRQMVREQSSGKRVLNLFCYTGSFSVYAAAGGASEVVSVDLSKTYLAWVEKNMALNFPGEKKHKVIHADVLQYLKELPAGSFDLIVMDPPTFSNSKRMEDILDIQRDHVSLVNDCLKALTQNGLLYFSTNYTKFILEKDKIHSSQIKDITRQTTPFDFAGKLKRQCFQITK
ncbi:class I SAM-dependent methyltransferase [Flavisolibacter ginsenosidimutans]|uniref:Methyltransferase domain-containing protein n=1 Tax=Flavisolibacter ginsenosidimutans TaxID=661481 RepID=A0A5B8UHY6_9BACT|nr:class I SAM-dependent methyltransferase [Flavisolibacter ginsenosidimutans]QEC56042.1 methyltransferase domain-containing protein [Flavisolibacter ginsenosidimutans]